MERLFAPKESRENETRCAVSPESAQALTRLGFSVEVESGIGRLCGFPDEAYTKVGATIAEDPEAAVGQADVVVRVRKPDTNAVNRLKRGALHISFLDPFQEKSLIAELRQAGTSAISMEMVPRITIAQKMDALSSQANLAGYMAVIKAAGRLPNAMPMLMTAAGTISPAKVFVIGVGVAGLQAIATAKRLGARVQAFDTRPAVEEQVQSLGAKFLKIDLGETGETKGGYAKELTPEQLEKQKAGMAKACAEADIVITTAKVFGRPAPRIVSEEIVAAMKPGSVIVDMAVESGGNVAGARLDEEVLTENGVRIIGIGALESICGQDSSRMYANNIVNLLEHFWDKEGNRLVLKTDDPILEGCLITHGGEVVHARFREEKAEEAPAPKPAEPTPTAEEPKPAETAAESSEPEKAPAAEPEPKAETTETREATESSDDTETPTDPKPGAAS